jgi:hypothetical protein
MKLQNLQKYSYNNKQDLAHSEHAGCFHCLSRFSAKDVVNFSDNKHGLCPYCCHDTVIGDVHIKGKWKISTPLLKEEFIELNKTYVTSIKY